MVSSLFGLDRMVSLASIVNRHDGKENIAYTILYGLPCSPCYVDLSESTMMVFVTSRLPRSQWVSVRQVEQVTRSILPSRAAVRYLEGRHGSGDGVMN